MDNYVTSSKGARGLWQFMPETARGYNLVVNEKVDQRTDPVLSTRAASDYLNNLLTRYNDNLEYALAAYNWGEGNVDKIDRKKNASLDTAYKFARTDFYKVIELKMVPPETQAHVLKVVAATICGLSPAECGLDDKKPLDPY